MPMALKFGRLVTYHEEVPPIKLHVPSPGLSKSRDQITSIYLYYQSAYGHQTCQEI